MKDTELNWLAGLVEGEGCFSICGSKGHNGVKYTGSPTLALGMTDADVMRRAGRLLGKVPYAPTVRHSPRTGEPYKPSYRLHLYGRTAVSVMVALYPLLGSRRRARIREVLELTGYLNELRSLPRVGLVHKKLYQGRVYKKV